MSGPDIPVVSILPRPDGLPQPPRGAAVWLGSRAGGPEHAVFDVALTISHGADRAFVGGCATLAGRNAWVRREGWIVAPNPEEARNA